jgi:HamA
MRDLALNVDELLASFPQEAHQAFVLVRVPEEQADAWLNALVDGIRRCYAADDFLEARAAEIGRSRADVLASLLPDRGAVMAGDFGEILVFIYQGAAEHPAAVIGPKKWRLKQDRSKPAPYSDVVQFIVPAWPDTSTADRILCSEVKTKSTSGDSTPIASAIADCEKDRIGRLAKTLVWLKERAIRDDLGSTSISHLERFIEATDHPPAQKMFRAVAVICSSLLEEELASAPDIASADYTLLVVAVPDLKRRYEALFDAVHVSVTDEQKQP